MKTRRTLPFKDALRVKAAELWLRLGEPTQALLEVEHLTKPAWRHHVAEAVLRAARAA